MTNYITPKEASKQLGVHWQTLKNWEKVGKIECIRTPGGKRLYDVDKYISQNNINKQVPQTIKNEVNILKKKICYCRVSTRNQKDNLDRQIHEKKVSKTYNNIGDSEWIKL